MTSRSLPELDYRDTAFVLFLGSHPRLGVEPGHLCEVLNLHSAQGDWSYPVVSMVKHLKGGDIVLRLLLLEVATMEKLTR